MDVMMFFGRERWRATSIDPSEVNLSLDRGPGTAFHHVRVTDPDELVALTRQGFHLVRRKGNDDALGPRKEERRTDMLGSTTPDAEAANS